VPVVEATAEFTSTPEATPLLEAAPPVTEAAAAPIAEPAPIVEPTPDSEPAPIAEPTPDSEPAPKAKAAMPLALEVFAPVAARLVFKRVNLDQGCSPRVAFKCAIPIAESCSPAPRRTSLRPAAQEFAASDASGPSTLRGLG
jgi:hypothetical protein